MFESLSRSESCPRRPTRIGVRSACPTLRTVGVSTPQSVTVRIQAGVVKFCGDNVSHELSLSFDVVAGRFLRRPVPALAGFCGGHFLRRPGSRAAFLPGDCALIC